MSYIPTMFLMIGNIGTGKSHFARKISRQNGGVIVSMDDISAGCHGGESDRYDTNYRPIYHAAEKAMIAAAFDAGQSVVIDRANINRPTRGRYINYWKNRGGVVGAVVTHYGSDASLKRRILKGRGVPRYVWESVHNSNLDRWQTPDEDEGFDFIVYMPEKFTFYAVDFDGGVVEDGFPDIGQENKGVVSLMRYLDAEMSNVIIVWSSRTKDYLWQARNYLVKNNIPFDYLNENPLFLQYSDKLWYDHHISSRNYQHTPQELNEQIDRLDRIDAEAFVSGRD